MLLPYLDEKRGSMNTSEELQRVFEADQDDRRGGNVALIDWEKVGARDRVREARVKELYMSGLLSTGEDYYHAAMVLQHAPEEEDFLLAHSLCIVSISKGEMRAKWLAAATLDRFLMRIKRPQQFGTQYSCDSLEGPMTLYSTSEQITDALRGEFDVPPIAEAIAREALMG